MDDFKNTAQKYKDEIMRLYKQHSEANPSKVISPEPVQKPIEKPVREPVREPVEEPVQDKEVKEEVKKEEITEGKTVEERYPEPVLPPYIYDNTEPSEDIPPPNNLKNDYTEQGFLIVNVCLANNAVPVDGALVLVSCKEDDEINILYIGITQDGKTPKIELPAPPAELSQVPMNNKPYAEYDITVYLDGFFEIKNENIPIFANQTSLRNISLVPQSFQKIKDNTIAYKQFEINL